MSPNAKPEVNLQRGGRYLENRYDAVTLPWVMKLIFAALYASITYSTMGLAGCYKTAVFCIDFRPLSYDILQVCSN